MSTDTARHVPRRRGEEAALALLRKRSVSQAGVTFFDEEILPPSDPKSTQLAQLKLAAFVSPPRAKYCAGVLGGSERRNAPTIVERPLLNRFLVDGPAGRLHLYATRSFTTTFRPSETEVRGSKNVPCVLGEERPGLMRLDALGVQPRRDLRGSPPASSGNRDTCVR
jgi:hypothetical protein